MSLTGVEVELLEEHLLKYPAGIDRNKWHRCEVEPCGLDLSKEFLEEFG